MNLSQFIKLLGRKKQTILAFLILFLIIAAIVTFLQTPKYSSKSKVLVVQKFGVNFDPYNLSRSNEFLANTLANVVNTNSFFIQVLNAGFDISKGYFPTDPEEQQKMWDKTVSAQAINTSGIIELQVLHKDKYQADQIMRAVDQVLKTKHTDYHGYGDQVEVKIVDQPVTSALPAVPNIPLNFTLAGAIGLLVAFTYIYLFPGENYSLKLASRKQNPISYDQAVEAINIMSREHATRNNVETRDVPYSFEQMAARKIDSQPAAPVVRERVADDIEVASQGSMQNIFGQPPLNR